MDKKTSIVSFRLVPAVKLAAERAAAADGRKLSSWLVKLVKDNLPAKGKKA